MPERKFFNLRSGYRIAALDWGGSNPLAILCHANGFCAATWSLVAELLREEFRVVALDCGLKYNQLRILTDLGCDVRVLPVNSSADEILAVDADGFFISNGPGDPEGVPKVVETVRTVIREVSFS